MSEASIVLQARIDQSDEAVNKIKKQISDIEKRVKAQKITVDLQVNEANVQRFFDVMTQAQEKINQTANKLNLDNIQRSLQEGSRSLDGMSKSMGEMRDRTLELSRINVDPITQDAISQVDTYRINLIETMKELRRFDELGNSSTVSQENTINYLKAQKDLYKDLKSIQGEIFALEKQAINVTDQQKTALQDQIDKRRDLAQEITKTIADNKLYNTEKERELNYARELQRIQLDIAKERNVDKQGTKAYAELNRLVKEEYKTRIDMVSADNQHLEVLKYQLDLNQKAQTGLKELINSKGLVNSKQLEYNNLLQLQDKLSANLLEKEAKEYDSSRIKVLKDIQSINSEILQKKKQSVKADGEELKTLQNQLNVLYEKRRVAVSDANLTDQEKVVVASQIQSIVKQTQDMEELHTAKMKDAEKKRAEEYVILWEKALKQRQLKEEEMQLKEQNRVDKLGTKLGEYDPSSVNFEDTEALRQYVLALQEKGAEIRKMAPLMDSYGNRMMQFTVVTKQANDKIKEQKLVVDQNTKSLYMQSEALRPNINRMLSFAHQMGIAFTRLVQWGGATGILYGSLRKLREGIETIKELDKELTQVSINSGEGAEKMKQLAQSYAELGKQMGKTVGEISKVYTELVRQGLSLVESQNRMDTILKLSSAGQVDTPRTMSYITASVNALGESAEKTADVMIYAGQLTASSVEEIGEAFTKTASSARATGATIEWLSAILSTLTEVTQESPSSLGNSMKTLLARFNSVNEETGEFNQEINKVQKAFSAVGVQFTDAAGQIRPVHELLVDLNEVWGKLDKNTRMWIATSAAGTMQQNRFIAIMDNFNRVQEIHNDLLDAGGTLNRSYAVYLDSVEASMNRAKAAFEGMWINGVDSEMIKAWYDMTASFANWASEVGVLNVGLSALATILLLANKRVRDLLLSKGSLLETQFRSILGIKQETKETEKLAIAQGKATTTTGLFAAAQGLTGRELAKTIAKLIGARVAVVAFQAAATLGTGILINFAVQGIMKVFTSTMRAKQEMEEFTKTISDNVKTHRESIKSLKDIREEFDNLNKKLGENRDLNNLTSEEQEKYNHLVSKLVEIAPEVVRYYDEKGNAVVSYGLKLDDLIEKEQMLMELERNKMVAKSSEIVNQTEKEINKTKKEQLELEKEIASQRKVLEELIKGTEDKRDKDYITSETLEKDLRRIALAEEKLVSLQAKYAELNGVIGTQELKQRELLMVHMEALDAIEGISDAIRNIAKDEILEIFNEEGYETAYQTIGKFEEALLGLISATKDKSIEIFSNDLNEVRKKLEDVLGSAEAVDVFLHKYQDSVRMTAEEHQQLSTAIGVTSEEFKALRDEIDSLNDVLAKAMSGKNLSTSEYEKLIDTYEEVAKYIAETGDLTLKNGEILRELRDEEQNQLRKSLQQKEMERQITLRNYREEISFQQSRLKYYEAVYGVESDSYRQQKEIVDEMSGILQQRESELTQATAKLKAFEAVYSQAFDQSNIDNFGEAFSNATSKLEDYRKILQEIKENGTLSGETNRDIVSKHIELAHLLGNEAEMRALLIQLIGDQEKTQLDAYKNTLLSNVHWSKQFFNNNKELFEKIAKFYELDLKNFKTAQELKMEIANKSVNSITQSYKGMLQSQSTGTIEFLEKQLQAVQQGIGLIESGSASGLVGAYFKELGTSDINKLRQMAQELQYQIEWERANESAFSGLDSVNFQTSASSKSRLKNIDLIELETDAYLKLKKALDEVERSLDRNSQILELATGSDRIALLGKEVDLLKEKQQLLHLMANQYRDESSTLRNRLSNTLNLNDGSMGVESYQAYMQVQQDIINSIIRQINATSNEKTREALESQKEALEKQVNKFKEDFERFIELEMNTIPDLGTEWWSLEIEKFNKSLETLDTHLGKYNNRITHINEMLSLMSTLRADNSKELEKEYQLMQQISSIYEDSLEDINKRLTENSKMILSYENQLKALGSIRNQEYQGVANRLTMARAEQDKLYELQREALVSLGSQQKMVIDKYIEHLNKAKEETIKSLRDIRTEMDKFSKNEFLISLESIIADLDRIDGIFKSGVDFNLSTKEARTEIRDWRKYVLDSAKDIDSLQKNIESVMNRQATTQEQLNSKREDLIKIIKEQIGLENDLKDVGESLAEDIERTALEYKKVENALENQIAMKEKELEMLQEQFNKEDKIRSMLQKQLDLMRAMDDTRYSYITGMGEEIFTYDQGKVLELQKQIAEATRSDKRQEMLDKLQDEIKEMKDNLSTTKDIHSKQLEILRLANNGISQLVSILSSNIEDGLGENGMDKIHQSISDIFIEDVKKAMQPFIDNLEGVWKSILDRVGIGVVSDERKMQISATSSSTSTNIPSASTGVYIVQPNEKLDDIAKKLGTTVEELMKMNPNITNPRLIYPNQKIKLPASFGSGGYTGEWGKEGKLGVLHEKEIILKENDTKNILDAVSIGREFSNLLSNSDINNALKVNDKKIDNRQYVIENVNLPNVSNGKDFVSELSKFWRRGMPEMY